MKKTALTIAIAAASLGLAACGERDGNNSAEDMNAAGEATENAGTGESGNEAGGAGSGNASSGGSAAAGSWPQGARIVEENGVTYRVDPSGTRVRLGDNESRVVVENGVRYRVDPGGARVRIDERGIGIDVDPPRVDVDGPEVNVQVNTSR